MRMAHAHALTNGAWGRLRAYGATAAYPNTTRNTINIPRMKERYVGTPPNLNISKKVSSAIIRPFRYFVLTFTVLEEPLTRPA